MLLFACCFFPVPPKLTLDLGSSVSSVSEPDLSGMSDKEPKEPAKKDDGQKADKQDEPAKPGDGSQSEGKNKLKELTHERDPCSLATELRVISAGNWSRSLSL